MKKCRYSINGKCTNNSVACNVCDSTNNEMLSCAPLQRCIVIYDDNWLIDAEENDGGIQNNEELSINDKIVDLIDQLIDARREANGRGNCPYFTDSHCPKRESDITCDDCKEQYYEEMKEELIEEYTMK